ncbi:hypothetical protein CRUP_009032 [Coryphaenoides rupestris]|nr:hypothetical protein CRUP_009032 [Coryphaenoides rupestris]
MEGSQNELVKSKNATDNALQERDELKTTDHFSNMMEADREEITVMRAQTKNDFHDMEARAGRGKAYWAMSSSPATTQQLSASHIKQNYYVRLSKKLRLALK